MNSSIVQINLLQFASVYLLLIIIIVIMKKSKVDQTKLLVVASIRMSVQLVLAGLILTYIFKNPAWYFTVAYVGAMAVFSIVRAFKRSPWLNKKFKIVVAVSLAGSGVFVLLFFIIGVVGINIFNPQYTIPLGGMIFGNAMTGITLGLKSFHDSIYSQRSKVETLLNLGVTPKKILAPFSNSALETALLPTMNSMLGMGLISLPGMMTGQILSGTLPMTAILYQIAIMISVCTVVCLASFITLNLGSRTLCNKKNQIEL